MLKQYRKLVTGAVAAAAIATIAAVGVTAAGAATRTGPAVSGTEHFQLMTTSSTASTSSAIGYGVFTDFGVDHPGAKVDTITLQHGSFQVTHSKGTGTQHFNPKTCLFQISQQGTYTVGNGTGKYAGIKGSGTYQLSILGIGAKSGGVCANPQTTPALAFHQVINASGPVTLP